MNSNQIKCLLISESSPFKSFEISKIAVRHWVKAFRQRLKIVFKICYCLIGLSYLAQALIRNLIF